jgi:hypothetical protein
MLKKQRKKATLELSNGMKFEGRLIGADVCVSGEMVFNTGYARIQRVNVRSVLYRTDTGIQFLPYRKLWCPCLKWRGFFMAYGMKAVLLRLMR